MTPLWGFCAPSLGVQLVSTFPPHGVTHKGAVGVSPVPRVSRGSGRQSSGPFHDGLRLHSAWTTPSSVHACAGVGGGGDSAAGALAPQGICWLPTFLRVPDPTPAVLFTSCVFPDPLEHELTDLPTCVDGAEMAGYQLPDVQGCFPDGKRRAPVLGQGLNSWKVTCGA